MTATQWSALPTDPAIPTRFDAALYLWLANRAATVEPRTLGSDQELLHLIPQSYLTRELATIGPCELAEILAGLRSQDLDELSRRRHRASLSAFFRWCARIGLQVRTATQPEPAPTVVALRRGVG